MTRYGQDIYTSPFTNFGFKWLFGTEANKELLRSFLNALLVEEETLETIEYMSAEQLGIQPYEQKQVYGVSCQNLRHETIVAELQCSHVQYWKNREAFFDTFPLREQAPQGTDWDCPRKQVYAIGILNFTFDNDPNFIHRVMSNEIEKIINYDKVKFIYIELPKFTKKGHELNTLLDKWLYALKHFSTFDERPATLDEPIFHQLFNVASLSSLSPNEQAAYETSLMIARDNYNIIESARREGMATGIAERRAQQLIVRKKLQGELADKLLKSLTKIALDLLWEGKTTEQIEDYLCQLQQFLETFSISTLSIMFQ